MTNRKPTNDKVELINHGQKIMAIHDSVDRQRKDLQRVEKAVADVHELLRVNSETASNERRELGEKVERAVAAFERLTLERKEAQALKEQIAVYLASSTSALEALRKEVYDLRDEIHRERERYFNN